MSHSVEKIGGTSMSDYAAVRDNIILAGAEGDHLYGRIFVVSAYGGVTDMLLENKRNGNPGVYGLFADDEGSEALWREALRNVAKALHQINEELFDDAEQLNEANAFIDGRLFEAERCMDNLHRLCQHGHFGLEDHLLTVREMLASIGEVHSAWNTAKLLQRDGINARFVDLSGWRMESAIPLDAHILRELDKIDVQKELPIVTGYAYCSEGLMATFDRGYSEMTFSRLAVMSKADEAIIHKEYHLSSADPRLVGAEKVVPIGRTNYDVADQLANLGMEAIHPRAAKGLRQDNIPLRVKNTFEPEHSGTLIDGEYTSERPCVEIIAGRKQVYALEVFDQDMVGSLWDYEQKILSAISRFKATVITKDINANTITHYLGTNLKTVKRIVKAVSDEFTTAEVSTRKVAIVSAIGSDMKVPGMLAKTVSALASADISVLAMHQSMRQVDMQFVINEDDYEAAVANLHRCLVEVHDHGEAICVA
ncbi:MULTISPECIES: aspartate kinase [Spongiibacter]|mgnify:FL=1|uniref:aspartate kinase n=1 Tax=Spongiibacter TaxID=630749 RepID=UPI000C0B908E|nr:MULTISPECIES: aspartate kinase [Spongiibacter]MAK45407.1 aspartate kinase [Spongiibacter sp.]MBM7422031.1 aspartate kinase [Spongiibacter marinus]